jgi:hypothetical protein
MFGAMETTRAGRLGSAKANSCTSFKKTALWENPPSQIIEQIKPAQNSPAAARIVFDFRIIFDLNLLDSLHKKIPRPSQSLGISRFYPQTRFVAESQRHEVYLDGRSSGSSDRPTGCAFPFI